VPDIVDAPTRSKMMSGIRSRDTKPELAVRRWFHAHGYRYRLHDRRLPGTPDMVLPKHQSVIFVHGCFWHQHPGCRYATRPTSNAEFWSEKLARNRTRFGEQERSLLESGWSVFVIWECETRVDLDVAASIVARGLAADRHAMR
jgi:DNA mismatch endonuclease (patch repair protein)